MKQVFLGYKREVDRFCGLDLVEKPQGSARFSQMIAALVLAFKPDLVS
jgi:hypothetical protein